MEVIYEMDGRGNRLPIDWFGHERIMARFEGVRITPLLGEGVHFWDPGLAWNTPGEAK